VRRRGGDGGPVRRPRRSAAVPLLIGLLAAATGCSIGPDRTDPEARVESPPGRSEPVHSDPAGSVAPENPGMPRIDPEHGAWIPAAPPSGWIVDDDSVRAILSRERLVFVHPRMSGPYPPDVVLLRFTPVSTLAERRRAVELAGGTLVGGDGSHHYVLVGLECDDLPVWCAIDRLSELPQVIFVGTHDVGIGPLDR
jgi:hypothetical protein